jgi:cystathionine beta-lyase
MFNFDTTPNHRTNGSFRWNMKDMPPDVIGMGTADLDYYCAPVIRDVLMKVAEENCYNYRQHSHAYFDALENWYLRRYGLQTQESWFSNIPSTIGAVRVALETFSHKGKYVITQTPAFAPLMSAVSSAGYKLLANPLVPEGNHFKIDFDDFENKLKTYHPDFFLLVNPHNPTCKVFTKAELEKLVALCYQYNVTIVSDEVHSLILYGSAKHTPILAVNETARQISVQVLSLSKGYNIMSLPHAIITIANPKMQELWQRQIMGFSFGYAVNRFAIEAVTTILQGKADDWMEELTKYLFRNQQMLLNWITDRHLPLKAYVPESSFLLWVDCNEAHIGRSHLDRYILEKTHVHLDDGAEFGRDGEGFIRINYAVTQKFLKEAMERLESCFEKR